MLIVKDEQRSIGMSKDGNPMIVVRKYKLFGFITLYKYRLQYKDGGQIK